MNSTTDQTLNIQDVTQIFSKHRWFILLSTLFCAIFFTIVSSKLPKKYKTHFILTIYGKYFQSPLVGDFVPGISESGEVAAQRDSLIRQALTPEYLDSLGEKYGIYVSSHNPVHEVSSLQELRLRLKTLAVAYGLYEPGGKESQLSEERQALRARIEIFSLNSTTFNIGFSYADPGITLQVTQDIYNHVIQSLLEIRMHTLVNLRDAIQKRLESLSVNMASLSKAPSEPPQEDQPPVEKELKEVRRQIRTLTAQYTEEHPLVQELRDRERTLVRWQNNSAPQVPDQTLDAERPRAEGGTGDAVRDIYSDLSKKLNYLNIAMDSDRQHQGDYFATLENPMYPANPLWPKTPLFFLWGLALGFFGSLFIAAIWEYFDRSTLHASALAQQLGIPLLGELPVFPSKTSLRPSAPAVPQLKAAPRK